MTSAARAAILAIVALAWAQSGCGPARVEAAATIERFLQAVQAEDLDELYCMMAGASTSEELGPDDAARRRGFEQWALSRYLEYEEGRDRGVVELDGSGIVLVKLLSLGRGTFYSHGRARPVGEDGVIIDSRLVFGYGSIDLSRFTPGTTFYVAGAPVGRVQGIRAPRGSREISVEPLETLELRWSLLALPARGSCPAGLTVADVEPIEGTAITTEVTWVF